MNQNYYSFRNQRFVPETYKRPFTDRFLKTTMHSSEDRIKPPSAKSPFTATTYNNSLGMCMVMNRTLNARDTMMTVFPSYGVMPDRDRPEMERSFHYPERDIGTG